MEIIYCKDRLSERGFWTVLALSQYRPTREKLRGLTQRYAADADIHAFAALDGETVAGLIVIKGTQGDSFEICSVAVLLAYRMRGVGRALVSHAAGVLGCTRIFAETDDDAVGFYRRCGFTIHSLGEKYPGVVRYRCMLDFQS